MIPAPKAAPRSPGDPAGAEVPLTTEITKEFTFEAAHHLPSVGPEHKCSRTHGHLFRVEVTVAGTVDPVMGWVMDFGDLARAAREVVASLDHRFLNDLPGLANPTSENLARYLFDRLSAKVPGVVAITIHESPSSRCTYRPGPGGPAPADVQIGVSGMVFSAAHLLVAPDGTREPLHGHDYRMSASAWLAPGAPANADETLRDCIRDAIADLEHRVLVATRPAVGRVEVREDVVALVLPDETVTLPRRDCTLIDAASTATEILAERVASRLAAMDALRSIGARRVEVVLLEGLEASARAVANVAE